MGSICKGTPSNRNVEPRNLFVVLDFRPLFKICKGDEDVHLISSESLSYPSPITRNSTDD